MKKIIVNITAVCLLFLLAFGCRDCTEQPDPVLSVSCDLAFSEPSLSSSSLYRMLVIDSIAYILETKGSYTTILAYNLDAGSIVWRESPFSDNEEWRDNSFFNTGYSIIGNSLWVPCYYSGNVYLVEVDMSDGFRKKLVLIGRIADGFNLDGGMTASCGSKVFFFAHAQGLCSVDTEALALLNEPGRLYEGTVELVNPYPADDYTGLLVETVDEDLIYSYRNVNNYSLSGIFRIDTDTVAPLWEIASEGVFQGCIVNNDCIFSSSATYPTPGIEDGEYVRFVSYDWDTGQLLNSYDCDVLSLTIPTCYDDCVIQTVPANIGKPYIICLEADTLALRWKHDFNGNYGDLYSGSNVQVNNGIVYRPSSQGVWLYDLESGELLATDESFAASSPENLNCSLKYNDLLVIQNGGSLLGIRMNFVKTGSGLVKE